MIPDKSAMNDPGHPSRSLNDQQLDELLESAEWPQPDADCISRLQTAWDEAIGTYSASPSRVAADAVHAKPVRARLRPVLLAASVLLAFLLGRWTQTDVHESRSADSQDEMDSGQQTAAAQDHTHRGAGPDQNNVVDMPKPKQETMVANEGTQATESVSPSPDKDFSRRRSYSKTLDLQLRVDSVLSCIENESVVDAECVEPLLKYRRESEYLLWQVVQNATGQRRVAAITAIGFIGSSVSVPSLVDTMRSKELRDASLNALKRCADENSLAVFVRQKQDRAVATDFARELTRRSAVRAVPVFLQLITVPECRDLCLPLANDFPAESVDVMLAALDSSLIRDRIAAAVLLGSRTDRNTLQRVVNLMQRYPTRWEPVAVLMWNGSPEAMSILKRMQNNPEQFVILQTASIQLKSFLAQGESP